MLDVLVYLPSSQWKVDEEEQIVEAEEEDNVDQQLCDDFNENPLVQSAIKTFFS